MSFRQRPLVGNTKTTMPPYFRSPISLTRFGRLVLLLIVAIGAFATTPGASAKEGDGFVNVIEVTGYLDPVMRDFVLDSIDHAVADGAEALVVQLDSPGSLLSKAELSDFEAKIRADHRIPIAVWVGGGPKPRAKGGVMRLFAAADITGLARLARIGNATPPADGSTDPLVGRVYDFRQAKAADLFTIDAPVLPDFVGQLDGRTIDGHRLDTAKAAEVVDGRQLSTLNGVRFAKLALLPRLVHTAASPSVAYLLFVIALSLFVFEFFTGGVGVAAAVGLGAFALSVAGLGALPTSPAGLALLMVAILGFAIDVQAGTPRFWTAVGAVSFVVGSLLLYSGDVRVPWFIIAVVTVMVVLFMVNGMPTMVRTRFATPTVGRESMIGEVGVARDAVNPDGVVTVLGAPWRARTNRATPISAGASIRVVSIDGLLLEVEPLEGGAKDAGH